MILFKIWISLVAVVIVFLLLFILFFDNILGRKEPLMKIREKTLVQLRKYMRLKPDNYYENISLDNIKQQLMRINEYGDNDLSKTKEELLTRLKLHERRRFFTLWHDGSTISNHSHILMTVMCTYDKAIYMTNEEYEETYGKHNTDGSEIEGG